MLEPCYVCRRGRPTAWQVPSLQAVVCDGCATAVGRLILSGEAAGLACWIELPNRPEPVLAAGSAGSGEPASAGPHVEVAQAYLEVGLVADALEAAAQALLTGAVASDPAVGRALEIVFAPRAFRPAEIGALRSRLFPG